MRRVVASVLYAILVTVAACATAAGQELTATTYETLRGIVDVRADELCWQKITWLPYWQGLVAAQQQDRPIFYWVYFGDPRGGC